MLSLTTTECGRQRPTTRHLYGLHKEPKYLEEQQDRGV